MDKIRQPKNWKAYQTCKPSAKNCSDVVRLDGQGNIIGVVSVKDSVKIANKAIRKQLEDEPKARHYQRELRIKATAQERLLYSKLKPALEAIGVKSFFQHTVYNEKSFYILDIYISKAKLCIEVDGMHHIYDSKQRYRDHMRDETLTSLDIETIRFQNEEIDKDVRSVVNSIMSAVCVRLGVESRANKDAKTLTQVASG